MSYFNAITLIGNLGKDPEVRKKTSSGWFVKLEIATAKKYKNAEGKSVADTQWHTVYLSNGTGKFAATYGKKGVKVLVTGELRHNKWEDKDGKTRYSSAVYGNEFKLLSQKATPKEAAENSGEDSSAEGHW